MTTKNPFSHATATQYVVSQLSPNNSADYNHGGTYQLTPSSVHPVLHVGVDALGYPIEETVPTLPWKYFLHPLGAVDKVPIRTSSVAGRGPEEDRYEMRLTFDLLRAGWIPAEYCPFTRQFDSVLRRRCLIENPDGVEDCGGHADGCEHLHAERERRTKMARARYDAYHAQFARMGPHEAASLLKRMAAAQATVADIATNSASPPGQPALRRRGAPVEEKE